MPDIAQFHERFRLLWPTDWHDVTVLAAVSGGADSVALARALAAADDRRPGRLMVAHFNHALRAEAAADESFVRELAGKLDLPFVAGHNQSPAGSAGIEEAARQARYDFLRAAAADVGARYVVTAHTADDQAETVLHRIVRGTGLGGLAGMRRARPLCDGVTLLRPLLTVRRAELLEYLRTLGQPFREDATNLDCRFTRNRLRHNLLPQLAEEYNPNVIEALLRLSRLAAEAQSLVDERVNGLMRHVAFETRRISFAVSPLADGPRYVIRELLLAAWRRQGWPEQSMGFEEWERLADSLLTAEARDGNLSLLPGGIRVLRQGDAVVLEKAAESYTSRGHE